MQSGKSRTLKPRFPIALAVLAASVVLAPSAAAAPGDLGVAMVKDINPAPGSSGSVDELTLFGGIALFVADNGVDGQELWRTDGTAAGTVMVKDINPGSDEDPPDADSSDPEALTVSGGAVYFVANDGVAGKELWKSDGTAAGTTLVKDINTGADDDPPEPDGSSIDWATNAGGTLLFAANDGANGTELWKSDGTPGGTQIVNGPTGIAPMSADSNPNSLESVGSTLFFAADDNATGMELWKVGPPYSTATQVADINGPGPASSGPIRLTDFNGTLFFAANDGSSGREPWKSTGGPLGPGGTERVKDINTTPDTSASSDQSSPVEVDGTLFFFADDGSTGTELWKSDGSEPGTVRVADINPGINGSGPGALAEVNDILFFTATISTTGVEPWKSDGGPLMGGTNLIADIRPGLPSSNPGVFGLPTEVGGAAFFSANDGSTGEELWRSDGGPLGTGTRMVADINATGGAGSIPGRLLDFNGTLLFRADDGINGAELWRTFIEGAAPPTLAAPTAVPPTPTPTTQRKKKCKRKKKGAGASKKCKKKK